MSRNLLMSTVMMFAIALGACATTGEAIDDSKLGTLASSLGITTEQAQGALGSMLNLAQGRLEVADYQKIAKWIPRADEYIALADKLGAYQGAVRNADDLTSAFDKIGLSADQAAQFVPAVTDYLAAAGGGEVAQLMTGALK